MGGPFLLFLLFALYRHILSLFCNPSLYELSLRSNAELRNDTPFLQDDKRIRLDLNVLVWSVLFVFYVFDVNNYPVRIVSYHNSRLLGIYLYTKFLLLVV